MENEEIAISEQNTFTDVAITSDKFPSFVDCDNDLQCYGLLTDDEIVDEVQKHLGEAEEDENSEDMCDDEEELNPPNIKEALYALDVLRKFAFYKDISTHDIENFEEKIINLEVRHMNQMKITDYFN